MIPNAITVARLCALPVFVWLYSLSAPGASWPAAILVLVVALSDVLDGWLARRYQWQSDLGRVLDPVTDRVLFLFLAGALLVFGALPWWAVVPLIVRDTLMLAGAALMLFHYHEKPRIMRGGRFANITLICGIEFFLIDARGDRLAGVRRRGDALRGDRVPLHLARVRAYRDRAASASLAAAPGRRTTRWPGPAAPVVRPRAAATQRVAP